MSQQPQEQAFKFDVFISYRHADLDGAVAGCLQKSLEHYKIPREIQKKCGKQSIQRVFRDEEELGAASDLFSEIEQNLKQSEFLVVICSPRILESKWCLREIETFIKYRDREHVLAVLVEGEPETAFPPILLEKGEPLAVDLRGKSKREVLRHAKQRMPRLAAPLLHCSYDELFQRRRVYMMRRVLALAGVVTAAALCFGAVTLWQNAAIQQNYLGKLENQSRYLAQLSGELLGQGDRDAALLVALEALPDGSEDDSRPYVAEARIALEQALYTYSYGYRYQLSPYKVLEHKGAVSSCTDYNEDENVLLTADTRIYVWDAGTCENICCWEDDTREFEDAKLVGNHCAAVLTDTGIFCFDYRTSEIVWEWNLPECDAVKYSYCSPYQLIWAYDSGNNRILCVDPYLKYHNTADYSGTVITDAHRFHLIDAATGESEAWTPEFLYERLEEYPIASIENLTFSPDGSRLALTTRFSEESGLYTNDLYVLTTGSQENSLLQTYYSEDLTLFDTPVSNITWLDDNTLAAVSTLKRAPSMGVLSKEIRWALDCWDIPSDQLRFTYEDASFSVNKSIYVQKVAEGADGTIPLISVVYGNVELSLDWYTGEPYSRIEDRSEIMLNHFWDSSTQVLITADGYLFVTTPLDDGIWAERYTAYHYYLDLDPIARAKWYGGKAFLFTSTAVYCYTPATDDGYKMLEEIPETGFFTQDGRYALIQGYDGHIFLYDTENYDLLWQDEYRKTYIGSTVALVNDQFAVYLDPVNSCLKVRTLTGDELPPVELEDVPPYLAESTSWCLRTAGEGSVFLWNETWTTTGSADKNVGIDETAVWLVDVERGIVTQRWSYLDLLESFPTPIDPEWVLFYLMAPAMTSSGRYIVFPYQAQGKAPGEGWSFERDDVDQSWIAVWDRETEQYLSLPETAVHGFSRQLSIQSYFWQDGWLSPQGDLIVLYDEESKLIRMIDLAQNTILHELAVDGVRSMEISFTPDGDHLIFQDDLLRLCVYHWRDGVYTQQDVTPSPGSMDFTFWQDGQVLSTFVNPGAMTSGFVNLYQYTGGGRYKLDTSVNQCNACDGRTVVINDNNISRLYHARTLDDLIAMARDILGGRELTPAERATYLID